MYSVLIVEDDAALLRGLKDNFETHGYRVRTACEGRAALDAVLADPPDLVLLDLNLPKLHGCEVLHFIRGREELERIPTIILTTCEDLESDCARRDLSADDVDRWLGAQAKDVSTRTLRLM